ncbi:MAG: nicotinate-nucleotide adenylyltransferase [Proteobacteria bacterium]|nr:nicotinate-nucleotide adenylyltransferase [Pseudomonadota bacterium]
MKRPSLPPLVSGLRVGLFGGSFNPPHEGHMLVAETALRRLGLDRLWWLVTPGNPLKDVSGLPSQEARMEACRALIGHEPRILVTGIEREIGTRYTAETIRFLKARAPAVNFVWIMGADNLVAFHRWQDWRWIVENVPIAIIDRPGSTLKAAASTAARTYAAYRIDESDAPRLASLAAPRWIFLHGPRSNQSSTKLRAGSLKSG